MADTQNLKFTKSHEWVRLDGDCAVVGITKHAEEELGDVALVQLPEVGRMLQREEKLGEIESIKAVSDLFAPIAGEVTEVNLNLESAPETVNVDPYGAGWLVKIRLHDAKDMTELLSSAEYDALLAE
jgi:glycine cleavage system H protein